VLGGGYAAGDVSGLLSFGAPLHVPTQAAVAPTVMAPAVVREPVTIDPPCGCATPLFDIGGEVAARKAHNANAYLTFGGDLAGIDASQSLDWPCGEYFFPEIRTLLGAALEWRVHGHVGVFVEGDLHLTGSLTVTLDPDAELDLVVAGSLFTTGRLFGAPGAAARARLWLGGSALSLGDQTQFGATVYAPQAVFTAGPRLDYAGALFIDKILVDDVRVSYDPSLVFLGQSCGRPPPPPVE
jgi:hypothetical protein